jgi:hypothetical protein
MKRLLIVLNLLAITFGAIAQNDTTRYTMVNGYGFTYNRLKAKAALVMPTDTVQNKLPGSVVVLNDTLYVRRANRWEAVSGGGVGIPSGGTTGQILAKDSDTNFDVSWIDNYTDDVRETVKASQSINKGQAVYVSGADGANVIVSKASNMSESTSSKTLGLLYQNLATNGQGFVIIQGRLSGLNTIGATAGDPVWLGTDGNLLYGMANKPVAPAHMVYLGVVTRVNSNNGEIFVHVQNGFEIQELHNVLITDSTNNQLLAYDSTTRLWKNKTIATVLGYTPVKTTDTAAMLDPYLREADTAALSARIDQRVKYTDTSAMLVPFARDTGVVHKAGTETITGAKTFISPVQIGTTNLGQLLTFTNYGNYAMGVQSGQLQLIVPGIAQKISLGYGSSGSFTPLFEVRDSDIVAYRKLRLFDMMQSDVSTSNWADPTAAGGTGQLFSYFPNATNNFGQGIAAVAGTKYDAWYQVGALNGGGFRFYRGTTELMRVTDSTKIASLAGSGTRMVTASATGVLSATSAVPPSGSGTLNYIPKWTPNGTTLGNSLLFDGGTYVGLGTASPSARFDMRGPSTDIGIRYIETTTGNTNQIQLGAESGVGYIEATAGVGSPIMSMRVAGSERMRIYSTGNVFVGSSPSDAGYKLDVNGTARFQGTIYTRAGTDVGIQMVNTSAIRNAGTQYFDFGAGGTGDFYLRGGSSLLNYLSILNNGNVGIGTASPNYKFVVEGSGFPLARFTSSYSGGGVQYTSALFGNVATNESAQIGYAYNSGTPANSFFHITPYGTSEGSTFSIKPNGNVGIGFSNPGSKLQVNGVIDAAGDNAPATGNGLVFGSYGTGGYKWIQSFASQPIHINPLGNNTIINPGSGLVGVGTTSPSEKLDVNGRARVRTIDSTASAMNVLYADATGVIKKASATAFPGGSGTTNYIPKWTGANTLGNSVLFENGTSIGLNTSSPLTASGYGIMTIRSGANGSLLQLTDGTIDYRMQLVNSDPIVKFGTYSNHGIEFILNNVQAHRFHANARVGINTITDAGYQLDVNGTLRSVNGANFATTSGNVGIGTTSPGWKLTVRGPATDYAGVFYSNNDFVGIGQYNLSAGTMGIEANSNLAFLTGGSIERMRITSGGTVGIGNNTSIAANTILQTAQSGDQTIRFAHTDNAVGRTVTLRLTNTNASYSDAGVYMQSIQGSGIDNYSMALGTTGVNQTTASERLRINNAGNVGIGTQSPAFRLDVQNLTGGGSMRLKGGTANSQGSAYFVTTASSTNTLMAIGDRAPIFGGKTDSLVSIYTGSGYPLLFDVGGSEKVRIESGGNVGIGTTTPGSYKLNVAGNMFTSGQLILDGIGQTLYRNTTNTIGFDIGLLGGSSDATSYIYQRANADMVFGTNNATRMRLFANGNLFVGSSPTDAGYRLDVNGNTRVTGKIDVTANTSIGQSIIRSGTVDVAAQVFNSNGWFLYGAEGANGGAIFTGSTPYAAVAGSGYNRPLQLATNNTVRMEIDSVGLVGINTVTPTERLDVNGRARIRTVDSTATATNMLYVDNNGVIKKTAVPGSSLMLLTDTVSVATGFTVIRDSARNKTVNYVNVTFDPNTYDGTATVQFGVYRTTSSFTTGSWQTIATIPAQYAPQSTVIFELPGYVPAESYYTAAMARFGSASEYTGAKVVRIDVNGNVDVRIGTVSASATQGGTNYVLIPITATWNIYNIPL